MGRVWRNQHFRSITCFFFWTSPYCLSMHSRAHLTGAFSFVYPLFFASTLGLYNSFAKTMEKCTNFFFENALSEGTFCTSFVQNPIKKNAGVFFSGFLEVFILFDI